MIIALVQIPPPPPPPPPARPQARPRDGHRANRWKAPASFTRSRGCAGKYYLNSEAGGGGIYEFDTRENAEAWFNDGWADWMEGRFGVRPTLTLFDNPVTLDNERGEGPPSTGARFPPPWASDPA